MLAGESRGREARELVRNIVEDTKLAGIERCREWVQAMPRSYAAHWLCGAMWNEGAWHIRTGKFAHEVSHAQFAIMRERLLHARALFLKAAELSPRPVQVLALLANNHFAAGDEEQAERYLKRAEKAVPWYPSIHAVRLTFSLPQWGGSQEAIEKAMERARAAGVEEDELLYFEDHYVARPHETPTPGAEQTYWVRAIAERPTWSRLESLGNYHWRLKHWHEVPPIADRLIALDPDRPEGYYMRAAAHEASGKHVAALLDYRMAVALGHDFSTEHLVRAHIQGFFGLPPKDWKKIDALCRYGAALGVPAAANCVGSTFYEAKILGEPFRFDITQSLSWHLLAARGGHFNAQHDVGWLLFAQRAPGVEPELAKRVGVYWLRRAAEQGQPYAQQKLKQANLPLSEPPERDNVGIVELLWSVLVQLFWRG